MGGRKCQICGEYSGYYPLCQYHNKLKEEGLVIKNEVGDYELLEIENKYCILCGKETFADNLFCKNCYDKRIKEEKKQFDHNRPPQNIIDHYFKLKNNLQKSKNKEEFEEQIILMQALADENLMQNGYGYLYERAKNDIFKELTKFNEKQKETVPEPTSSFNDEDFRNKWPREHQCDDGHYVRSKAELLIDNWLYNHGYLHAYEKLVFMDTEPDAIVLSDFYLPQGDVYIEFWGLEDDEKYNKRKEEKINLYDENHYKRIDLSEKDIKRLNDIMPRLLSKYIKK